MNHRRLSRTRFVMLMTPWMSGRSFGLTFSMLSIRSFKPWEYAEEGCLYCAFMTAMAIEPPCSVV